MQFTDFWYAVTDQPNPAVRGIACASWNAGLNQAAKIALECDNQILAAAILALREERAA